ncbi:MAG: hypothetical protein KGV51_06080, partial [Moraxellaceae bacterium]|nr:hypothetical protein [Moraxellaceae bacterium]
RTHSYRNINRPYNDIKLKNKGNGAYLNVDKYRKDGWVMVNGQAGEKSTSLTIDNWYPKNNATCIMNNDFVQLKSNLRKNAYLNWWLGGGSGNYAYYTKENDSSDRLRIRILNDDGDCLKNGDEIAFYDTSTVNGKKYFLQRRAYGKDTDKLYLWSKKVGDNATFIIEMAEGKKQDWTSKLNYGK